RAMPITLSGGEQQRVGIARAVVAKPKILLADEPTGNLDASSGETALNLLLQGASEQEQTLIVVTHSRAVAERCDRVLYLSDGHLIDSAEGVAW
ncbi:MAG: ATP-binding cassette domain-containing protein, partial [Granulosicoccaceae bacterium]